MRVDRKKKISFSFSKRLREREGGEVNHILTPLTHYLNSLVTVGELSGRRGICLPISLKIFKPYSVKLVVVVRPGQTHGALEFLN